MITVAGQKLLCSQLININPLDYPWRTAFFALPVLFFTYYSFQFLHHLDRGVTLAVPKKGFPVIKIFPGKIKLSNKYKLQHYNKPYLTGLFGLLFFSAAEFFLVIMFKALDYTFLIN